MDLQYPVGKFEYPRSTSPEERERSVQELARATGRFRQAIEGLDDAQLDTPYRPGGWNVRQVIHHVPDSHMNGYVRFRMALTEEEPLIKPYDERLWAELADAQTAPVQISLNLLENLHLRWVSLLRSLSDADFSRRLRHPEIGVVPLDSYLAGYAWHCRHHAAHITALRERMGWK